MRKGGPGRHHCEKRERAGWIAETPHSLQHLERGVRMGRTRKCFGAATPNLVAVKTESSASTNPHHHRDPATNVSNNSRPEFVWGGGQATETGETPLRIKERAGWMAETTTLTSASRERCSHGPHARVLQRQHPQSGCCQD